VDVSCGKGVLLIGNRLAKQPDVGEAAKLGQVVQVERVMPLNDTDAGFVLFLDSAPDDRKVGVEDGIVVCLNCILDVHPEAAGGLDVAKEYERAALVDGDWHPVEVDPT
jgi:hypothetical protein